MPEFPIQQIFSKSGESHRSVFSYARTDGEKRRDQVYWLTATEELSLTAR